MSNRDSLEYIRITMCEIELLEKALCQSIAYKEKFKKE